MPAGLNHCQKLKWRLQSPASLGYIQGVAPVCNPHWSYWHLLSPFPVEKNFLFHPKLFSLLLHYVKDFIIKLSKIPFMFAIFS